MMIFLVSLGIIFVLASWQLLDTIQTPNKTPRCVEISALEKELPRMVEILGSGSKKIVAKPSPKRKAKAKQLTKKKVKTKSTTRGIN